MKTHYKVVSHSLTCLIIAFCLQAGGNAGDEKAEKMEYDLDGAKTGLQVSAESIWRNGNGRTCLLDIALRNVSEQDIASRSTDVGREYGVRVWTPRGKLLAATPEPNPWPPIMGARKFKNIRATLKPGEKKKLVTLSFVELSQFAFDGPIIVQVLRYFEDSPYVLVSAPVLIEPGDGQMDLSESECDNAKDGNATDSGKEGL